MNKVNRRKIIAGSIGVIILITLCFGVRAFVQHINGTSPAQIESRQRALEAVEQTEKALSEESQWYRDQMSEPVTIKNSEGVDVTYGVQSAPCINSSETPQN